MRHVRINVKVSFYSHVTETLLTSVISEAGQFKCGKVCLSGSRASSSSSPLSYWCVRGR
jgi:hypothetical protein